MRKKGYFDIEMIHSNMSEYLGKQTNILADDTKLVRWQTLPSNYDIITSYITILTHLLRYENSKILALLFFH